MRNLNKLVPTHEDFAEGRIQAEGKLFSARFPEKFIRPRRTLPVAATAYSTVLFRSLAPAPTLSDVIEICSLADSQRPKNWYGEHRRRTRLFRHHWYLDQRTVVACHLIHLWWRSYGGFHHGTTVLPGLAQAMRYSIGQVATAKLIIGILSCRTRPSASVEKHLV